MTPTIRSTSTTSIWAGAPTSHSPPYCRLFQQPDAHLHDVQILAVTVPGIGAYLAGNPTVAHTWCPSGTVGNNASIQFYPQSDSVNLPTSVLGATTDGTHMLGASLNGSSITLDDIGLTIPRHAASCPETTTGTPPNQVETMKPLSTNPTLNGTVNLTGVTNATAVNQVVTGTAPTTASIHHGRAHRLRHLHHAQHVHHGRATTLLPAPDKRRRPRGYVTFADSYLVHSAHRSAGRRVFTR